MSGGSIRKIDEDCGKSKEQLQSPQSAWMSRWTRPSHSEAPQVHRSYRASEDFEDVSNQSCGPKPIRTFTMGASKSCEMRNAKPVRSFNVGESKSCEVAKPNIGKIPGSLVNEGMSSSLFKNDRDIGEIQALKAAVYDQNLVDRSKAIDSRTGIQLLSEGCHSLDKDGSSEDVLKSADVRMFTTSKSLQEIPTKSPSRIVLHNFDLEKHTLSKGKAVMSPIDAQDMALLKHDRHHVQFKPVELLLQEKNINVRKLPGLENVSYMGDGPRSLSVLGQNSLSNMQDSSGIRTFPGDCVASKEIERKMSYNSSHSQQKLQDCVGDVETARFRTTLDSVEGFPRLSQTTHRLLITEKADVNARVITRFDGSHSCNFLRLSAFFGRNVVGVKVLPMNSSLDTERKQFGEVKASKVTIRNESSAETDTMDLDSLKEMNSQSGEHSTKSTKMKDIPPMGGVTCSTEAKSRQPKRQIPDINVKLALAADPQDAMCASSSRTKSLVMDSFAPIFCDKADPGNRWVKRLKVSTSNYSYVQGRKNSGLSEDVNHENMSKLLLAKILKTGMPSAELTSTEEQRTDEPSKKDKEIVAEVDNKDKELLLSHPWIKRWLRNDEGDKEKKPETAPVLCEPQTSKLAIDDAQKEQFPSIGAMALMGKAMNGFEPCELKKRGSFTIWNTKSF